MFKKYFDHLQKELIKGHTPAKKGEIKKAKTTKTTKKEIEHIIQGMEGIIPSNLNLGTLKITDAGGYSPENIDFIAYKPFCRDMGVLFENSIPPELVFGAYFIVSSLNDETLTEVLQRVIQIKKVDRFAGEEQEAVIIPSFVICQGSNIGFPDLKNKVLDFYVSGSIENDLEFDIMAVLNKGIIIKDWREKRSFVALETAGDTLMWFFILMNEYLDVERGGGIDLRKYVRQPERYKEY